MVTKLVSKIAGPLISRFKSKSTMFEMFRKLDTGPEEWFRVEILDVLSSLHDIEIRSTNQKYEDDSGRPDFVLIFDREIYVIELKVLLTDRNYKTGYQRFCAGKSNRADFDALSNDEVSLVIYVHWSVHDDFEATKTNLQNRYRVACHRVEQIKQGDLDVTISFWIRRGEH